jgi:hypothetical protein
MPIIYTAEQERLQLPDLLPGWAVIVARRAGVWIALAAALAVMLAT